MSDVLITPASKKIEFKDASSNIDGLIKLDTNDNLVISSVNDLILGDGATDLHVGDGTNSIDLVFDQAGSIYSAGNKHLTIGKSSLNGNDVVVDSPNWSVTDAGVATFAAIQSYPGNIALNDGVKMTFGTGGDLEIFHDGSNAYIDSDTGLLRLDGASGVWLDDGGSNIMRVNNTEVLSYRGLNITGNSIFKGTHNEEVLKVRNTTGSNGGVTGITHLGISHWDSGTHSSTRITATEDSAASYRGSLSFGTRGADSDSAPTERMRITSAGKVGIGTNDPDHLLHVFSAGNAELEVERNAGAAILLQAQSATGVIGTSSNHDLAIKTNGSTRIQVENGGDVGIGTTDPDAKLHVEGSVLIDAFTAGAGAGLFFREGFLNTNQPSITVQDHNGSHPDGLAISAYDGISFRLNASEKMRIDSYGNLGIGTDTPAAKLDVDEVGDGTGQSGIGLRVRRNDSGTSVPLVKFIDDSTLNDGPSVLEIQNDAALGLKPSLMITGGTISIKEQANAPADTAAYGQLWVKNESPNELYFTNDAGNDIRLSSSAFNRYAQFFYQGDNVSNTANYDFKVLGANASSSNINSYGMPVAGVVKAMTIRNAGGGTITSTTNGATFAVRVNGAQSGTTDYETVVLDGDNMARAFGSGSGFAVATLDFNQAFAAGDALQVRRVSGDITFEEVLITLWIDFT